ncbi:MAG: hypothetical protein JWQ68_176, partial [Cryobacterium sp.]|nr:hypothetical protein [Cryobacterium sp.]
LMHGFPAVTVFLLVASASSFQLTAQVRTSEHSCSRADLQRGDCAEATGQFNDGGVDLSAGLDNGSAHSGNSLSGGGDVGEYPENAGASGAPNNPPGTGGNGSVATPGVVVVRDAFTVSCTAGSPCDPNLVVSISDLVNIKPVLPTQEMEPNGWVVTGLPANYLASASAHVRSGMLLGYPVEVRFAPVSYRWDYGDGGVRRSASGGASWAVLGLPEFSETGTSHIFREGGSVTVRMSVEYAAEYRFAGQSWRPVRGTLAVPADPLIALAGDARTVLVSRDCARNQRGPGC